MKYLVIEKEFFYDGHSEEADGEVKKYITDDPYFDNMDESKTYCDDLQEREDYETDDGPYYAQDSYHSRETFLKFKKLTEVEAEEIQHIFDQYNKITINI